MWRLDSLTWNTFCSIWSWEDIDMIGDLVTALEDIFKPRATLLWSDPSQLQAWQHPVCCQASLHAAYSANNSM